MNKGLTFAELENLGLESLKHTGQNPSLHDVRLLLMQAAGLDKAGLISNAGELCEPSVVNTFVGFLKRRGQHEPVFRILGHREFHGLELKLNDATLEPRDDTECLVETTLDLIADRNGSYRFLDLGTGTGAVVLALLKELPHAMAVGVDVEPGAVEMSRENALKNGFDERFDALQSDWFSSVDGEFDFIVSNPPYIASLVIERLQSEVRLFDPLIALDGGPDGLEAYRNVLGHAAGFLKKGGFVALEIGYDQKNSVSKLAADHTWSQLRTAKDLSGRDRVLVFQQ